MRHAMLVWLVIVALLRAVLPSSVFALSGATPPVVPPTCANVAETTRCQVGYAMAERPFSSVLPPTTANPTATSPISSTRVITYSYDLAGNRTSVTVNGTQTITHTYDAADQVVGWTYDGAGNLTSDGTTTYNYDALNHLSGTTTGSQPTAYTYNGDGTLTSAVTNEITTTYTKDLAASQSQILAATSGLTTTDYLYGQDTAPLAALAGGTHTWYGTDGQGSVRQTLSDTGSVLGSQNYDPFGQVEVGSSLTAPFGYTGELQDSTTGQEYLRARWYQPGSGTLLGVDPALASTDHPYAYAGNDPVNGSDPTGLGSCAFYDLVCQFNAFHDAARQSAFGQGFYAGTTSLIHGIGTEAGALGNTTVSCLNPFDQTNCQNQRAANAATFAYVYAHPGDAVRSALLAAIAPYACHNTGYALGYGLPQLALSALGALGEGGAILADTSTVEPGLADLPVAGEVGTGSVASYGSGALRIYRLEEPSHPNTGLTLEQAAVAAQRNGIDMRMFELAVENALRPGQKGFTSYTPLNLLLTAFKVYRAPSGRFDLPPKNWTT